MTGIFKKAFFSIALLTMHGCQKNPCAESNDHQYVCGQIDLLKNPRIPAQKDLQVEATCARFTQKGNKAGIAICQDYALLLKGRGL